MTNREEISDDSTFVYRWLGQVTFEQARVAQQQLVKRRIADECSDAVLFCEHPLTLSLGKRSGEQDAAEAREYFETQGAEIVMANRGGEATYHGPGQLVIYPVVSLAARGIGVKSFVRLGLEALSDAADSFGLSTVPALDPAGLWVFDEPGLCPQRREEFLLRGRKIAAVGLRIVRGVTDHGFSLNIDCNLDHYRGFSPCGHKNLAVTSFVREIGRQGIRLEMVAETVYLALRNRLLKQKTASERLGKGEQDIKLFVF